MGRRSLSVGVKAAIVGGIFVVLAAVITLLPWTADRRSQAQRETPAVQIIDLVYLAIERKIGVNAILWNRSGRACAVTSFSLIWSQGEPPEPPPPFAYVIVPNRVYSLEPRIDVSKETWKGAVKGTVSPPREKTNVHAIKYLIAGSCHVYPNGAWFFSFDFPIREQLDHDDHVSISVVIPESIPITGIGRKSGEGYPSVLPDLGRHTTGDPPNEFRLQAFLKDRGVTDLTLLVTYADDRHTTLTKRGGWPTR